MEKENKIDFELPNANKIFVEAFLLGLLFSVVPLMLYVIIWYIYLF